MNKIILTKNTALLATGVYAIRNKLNGKLYVGSAAKSFYDRWHIHLSDLRSDKPHHSRYLQRSWGKHGEEAFEFIVLENCPPEQCIEREQWWLDETQSADSEFGYNMSPTAGSPLGIKRSEATKQRTSEGAKNRTDEAKKRFHEATKTPERRALSSSINKGKVFNSELRQKISEGTKAAMTAEIKAHISKMLTGVQLTEEHKQAISKSTKGLKKKASTRQKMSEYHQNRTPEHQAKITASIRATVARKREAKEQERMKLLESMFTEEQLINFGIKKRKEHTDGK